jgi:hypothetical protein
MKSNSPAILTSVNPHDDSITITMKTEKAKVLFDNSFNMALDFDQISLQKWDERNQSCM